MISKLVGKVRKMRQEVIIGWCAIVAGGLLGSISIYAHYQTRELTAPIVAGLLMALLILVGSHFRSRLKVLEDKVERLTS